MTVEYFLLGASLVFLVTAVVIWVAFLRPVPRKSADGVIVTRHHKPADTYYQYPVGGMRQGFWGPQRIPIAACEVFTIQMDGTGDEVPFALDPAAAEGFAVGQRVRVAYEERGIPPFWRRATIWEMSPAG